MQPVALGEQAISPTAKAAEEAVGRLNDRLAMTNSETVKADEQVRLLEASGRRMVEALSKPNDDSSADWSRGLRERFSGLPGMLDSTEKEANQILRRVEEGVDKPRPKVLFEPGETLPTLCPPANVGPAHRVTNPEEALAAMFGTL